MPFDSPFTPADAVPVIDPRAAARNAAVDWVMSNRHRAEVAGNRESRHLGVTDAQPTASSAGRRGVTSTVVLAGAMALAACGGGSTDTSNPTITTDRASTTTDSPTTTDAPTTSNAPTTTASSPATTDGSTPTTAPEPTTTSTSPEPERDPREQAWREAYTAYVRALQGEGGPGGAANPDYQDFLDRFAEPEETEQRGVLGQLRDAGIVFSGQVSFGSAPQITVNADGTVTIVDCIFDTQRASASFGELPIDPRSGKAWPAAGGTFAPTEAILAPDGETWDISSLREVEGLACVLPADQ